MGAGALPKALILLYGGALADRLDGRRTMILANLARIAVLVVAAIAVLVWGLSLALLITVAVVFGAVDALYAPASGTLPRRMVRSEDLVKLSAGTQLATRMAAFAGAPLGGLLVAHGGLVTVMLVDAASFVVIALALAFVVKPRLPQPASEGHSIRADLRAGFAYLKQDVRARTLVIAFSGLNLCVGPILAVGLVQRTHTEGWGPAWYGWFQAASGVTAAAGAVVAMRWKPTDLARSGLLALVVQAAGCAMIGVVPRLAVFVAMAMISCTAGLASAQLSAAFQQSVDPQYLGRSYSIVNLSDEALMPLAMTGFGALISLSSIPVACVVVGVLFAALVLWAAIRVQPHAEPAGARPGERP
ncbi:hypothetical protein GCM10010530_52500 [Kribbella aluminosa]